MQRDVEDSKEPYGLVAVVVVMMLMLSALMGVLLHKEGNRMKEMIMRSDTAMREMSTGGSNGL
jgi:hypothetical protein